MNRLEDLPSTRTFDVRVVVRSSLTLFRRRAPLYLLIAAALWSPWYVALILFYPNESSLSSHEFVLGDGLFRCLVHGLSGSLIMYPIISELRGDKNGYVTLFIRGLRTAVPATLAALASGAIVFLGLVALVIPGLVLYCVYFVCLPIATVENLGVGKVLQRSYRLTAGRKIPIFALAAAFFIAVGTFAWVLSRVLSALFGSANDAAVMLWTYFATDTVHTALLSVLAATIYQALVVEKDGLDTRKVAEFFD